ncbi:MAG TPA: FAD-dependent oxidoreductase [Patescibacteria group bacterium]|nr:FAD-dependent oxidoreductase [Patescibacteria group bacterium]
MTLTLFEKEHLVDNVWAFRFKSSEPLTWVAGQYVRVELPHESPDEEGARRWFTNSAAPYEGILQITTRVTDSTFKQALFQLELGSTNVQLIEAPEGDFILQNSELPIVFVAGGIGVTPFRSIIKQRIHDAQPVNVSLVYGSRTPEVPFKNELTEWMAADPTLKVHYVSGNPLTAESIDREIPTLNTSLVYLSGPEPMVEALGDDLKSHGLPEAQLKQDFFPNYDENNY